MRKLKMYCPENDWSCPYFKNGECGLDNPADECDTYMCYADDNDEYMTNEPRTAFED